MKKALVAALFLIASIVLTTANAQAQYTEKVVYAFTGQSDGSYPSSNLISDSAGNLYGATNNGGNTTGTGCGPSGCGVIFELSPVSGGGWTETVLYAFAGGSDGANPYGGLIFDAAGSLYGTTSDEGISTCVPVQSCGTVFKMTPVPGAGWTESVIYSFKGGKDGRNPSGNLVFDKSGNLYGTTVAGGGGMNGDCFGDGCGTVFELAPTSSGGWKETVLHAFTGGKDGWAPVGSLVLDATANLYGTTTQGGMTVSGVNGCPYGCGVVFKLTPGTVGWRESVLHTFTNGNDGGSPVNSGVVFDAAGNLYGTTSSGGSGQLGVVYKLTPGPLGGWIEAAIHSFPAAGILGGSPMANVVFDSNGNLYGTTLGGYIGTQCGSVFELKPTSNGWRQSLLYGFPEISDGDMPRSSLTVDGVGNLYGTTALGGAGQHGLVYELSLASSEAK
jgi:uncharacterized repeat protein (TIGR03803 family)